MCSLLPYSILSDRTNVIKVFKKKLNIAKFLNGFRTKGRTV